MDYKFFSSHSWGFIYWSITIKGQAVHNTSRMEGNVFNYWLELGGHLFMSFQEVEEEDLTPIKNTEMKINNNCTLQHCLELAKQAVSKLFFGIIETLTHVFVQETFLCV